MAGVSDTQFLAFSRFVNFACELFSKPFLLQNVACAQSYKEYVPRYYDKLLGPGATPMNSRHLKWFRRLQPLLSLPPGATIVDYGGGYGLDSIFLASSGYRVIFYEITPNHTAIAEFFRDRWQGRFGSVEMETVLANGENRAKLRISADAVFMDEVAHHVEPAENAFRDAAEMLRDGGHLFLLEPNYMSLAVQIYFLRVRGFRTVVKQVDENTKREVLYGNEHIRPFFTWNRMARAAGFRLKEANYVIPWLMKDKESPFSRGRRILETLPLSRHVLASHITYHYVRS